MIYVMSDLHGRKDRFEDVLSQIDFNEKDTLYILGDVIDRNPQGIALLRYIMSKTNIKLLLGNHEYMMINALLNESNKELWYYNGGEITHLRWKKYRIAQRRKMLEYLQNLSVMETIEVDNKLYRLVHGRSPREKALMLLGADNLKKEIVWERVHRYDKGPQNMIVVFGHTPTINYQDGSPLRIWYGENLIGIDCGAAYPSGRLACLRLDDMKEFYSRM